MLGRQTRIRHSTHSRLVIQTLPGALRRDSARRPILPDAHRPYKQLPSLAVAICPSLCLWLAQR